MPGSGHLQAEREQVPTNLPAEHIPASDPASISTLTPVPTYSIDVRLTPVEQVLTALARDQRIGLELRPGVEGLVSLSIFNRPLPELIERLCDQADLRCEFDGKHLAVMPDTPFLRAYRVDYVNLARDMNGTIATSTQIATSSSAVDARGSSSGTAGNASLTQISVKATNHFWETLENNIRALLKEHERSIRKPQCEAARRLKPAIEASCESGADAGESASVISNRETGALMVFANASQHRKLAEFIDLVQGAAQRQVMIEATIVEVTLADGYRQGIDWNRLGVPFISMNPRSASGAMQPSVSYLSNQLDVRLDWLETFGTVKVLSSPKLSVLNNQTAILKVVEEIVYFLVDASVTEYGNSDRLRITATTKPQSVSVGLVMTITPQIGRDGAIILGVRPTISSISGFKDDPNPSLGSIPNRVPQIRTREMESVLRLADGEIAVLGGLMEDKLDTDTNRIPLLGAIPLLGELFTRRENSTRRSELVIFLRPRLIRHPGIGGDYAPERAVLPDGSFLRHDAP
jgi:general secretion pathway protein D